MRRTRILATIGPASNDPTTIRALIAAGADAFRLNFSHGTAEEHADRAASSGRSRETMGRDVAVLQDLGGPKIRTGPARRPDPSGSGRSPDDRTRRRSSAARIDCPVHSRPCSRRCRPGDRLLIDDGRIELEVETATPDTHRRARGRPAACAVAARGSTCRTAALQTSALTDKDRRDLAAGIAMGVDLVAVSFVQSARDMVDVRMAATAAGAPALPLIAKIEKPRAVDHIDDIMAVSDGLMVARGDLGRRSAARDAARRPEAHRQAPRAIAACR